jgi:hypothetical protein
MTSDQSFKFPSIFIVFFGAYADCIFQEPVCGDDFPLIDKE